jgi:hypothetical protein
MARALELSLAIPASEGNGCNTKKFCSVFDGEVILQGGWANLPQHYSRLYQEFLGLTLNSTKLKRRFDRQQRGGGVLAVKHLIEHERIFTQAVYASVVFLAGFVGEVVAMAAAEVFATSEIQLQDPPIAGIPILDEWADEPPPLSPVTTGPGGEADGVIKVLLLAAVSLRLGVLKADFPRPFMN